MRPNIKPSHLIAISSASPFMLRYSLTPPPLYLTIGSNCPPLTDLRPTETTPLCQEPLQRERDHATKLDFFGLFSFLLTLGNIQTTIPKRDHRKIKTE
jgi:hypothetical protein